MELSFDSAFSSGALVGHLSYLLLIVSMLMRRLGPLRILALASALVAILYDIVWLQNPVGAFWESLLAAVNIGQLTRIHLENRRARFSPEEASFVDRRWLGLSTAQRRQLLDLGEWMNCDPGTRLTEEGKPAGRLCYLVAGSVQISHQGTILTSCGPDSFIGEMTVLTREPATGTSVVAEPSRFWAVDAEKLRQKIRKVPEIGQELEADFSRNLREKLLRANGFIRP